MVQAFQPSIADSPVTAFYPFLRPQKHPPLPHFCRNLSKIKGLGRKHPLRPVETKNLPPSPPARIRLSLESLPGRSKVPKSEGPGAPIFEASQVHDTKVYWPT